MPAGQPRLQGRTIELMVCSSGRTLGLLNLAVGADLNGFLGTHTHTHRIPGSLNRAKRRSRNRKVVGSIPGVGMSGGGRWQPCVKGILSREIAK